MAVYVIDATAIISLGGVCADSPHSLRDLEDAMTALAIRQEILCPPTVLQRCQQVGADEDGTRWLRSNSGHFRGAEEPWEYVETVQATCEDMIDPDDTAENVQVSVLALVLKLVAAGVVEVILVTDQWADSPWQISQSTGARRLGLNAISVEQFVTDVMS